MALPERDYGAQIAGARRTARRVHVFAAISWIGGWAAIIACLIAWLGFGVSILDSLEIMLAIGVAGLLGGVGLYAQSRNLDLSASRLEIALRTTGT
jgi:hypothetical protein